MHVGVRVCFAPEQSRLARSGARGDVEQEAVPPHRAVSLPDSVSPAIAVGTGPAT